MFMILLLCDVCAQTSIFDILHTKYTFQWTDDVLFMKIYLSQEPLDQI